MSPHKPAKRLVYPQGEQNLIPRESGNGGFAGDSPPRPEYAVTHIDSDSFGHVPDAAPTDLPCVPRFVAKGGWLRCGYIDLLKRDGEAGGANATAAVELELIGETKVTPHVGQHGPAPEVLCLYDADRVWVTWAEVFVESQVCLVNGASVSTLGFQANSTIGSLKRRSRSSACREA